ncbi:MAG: hypothetical protein LUB83_02460 [Prevotellaceae bacterium]|nr:hypothetical protein [Prevotellaceae bacterium]
MKDVRLCRFPNLRSTTFSSMTWEEFYRELLSDKHKRATEAYRATLREMTALETGGRADAQAGKDLMASYKRLKGEYKLNQPAVVAMCSLEGGRTNANVTGYTGVIMVDIDGLADDEFPDILARVKAEPYSLLTHTTISGLGIRVFCRMAGDVDAHNFGACWQAVNRHYAGIAGVEVDEACKNATRMSVICHDKDALHRPDAVPFPMPVERKVKKEREKAGRKPGTRARYTARQVDDAVRRMLEKEGLAYAPGSHNRYVHRALSLMNRLGVCVQDATEWAWERFADSDAPDNSLNAVIHSVYARTGEHGTMTLRDTKRALRGGDARRLSAEQARQMEDFLKEHCRLRFNTLINQIEILPLKETRARWEKIDSEDLDTSLQAAGGAECGRHAHTKPASKGDKETPLGREMKRLLEEEQGEPLQETDALHDGSRDEEWDDGWRRITDRMENSLWYAMQRRGIPVELAHLRNLLQSDFVPEHFPMKAYLDKLPAWDGTTDFIGTLAGMVHCTGCDEKTFRTYFRRWLVGMVASALSRKVVNHVIFVLIGPQGAYKSSFMERILPPPLQRYYNLKTNSQYFTKDDAFTITENYIVNFEEIDTMRPGELNHLKALTTSSFINERPAYGHNKIRLPHVASFCATGNKTEFLSDDTGNRRWLPFEVERIDNPLTTPIDYEGVYSQVKSLLARGYRYWFNAKEVDALNRRNRYFEEENTARNLLLVYYRRPAGDERAKYLNTGQIMLRFGGAVRLNKTQLIRALKELGFEQKHTKNGRFWLMVERTAEEIERMLPEAVEELETPGNGLSEATGDADATRDAGGDASKPADDKTLFPDEDEERERFEW